MKNWLNKPFPLIEGTQQQVLVSFLFASFVYLFLFIFQPFGISEAHYYYSQYSKNTYLVGFFVITFLVMMLNYLVSSFLFKQSFSPENWTVGKNISFLLWQITLIGVFNWWYSISFKHEFTDGHNLFEFLFMTMAVGLFPSIFLTLYTERYFSNKHQLIAKELDIKIHEPIKKEEIQIKILADNKKEIIELELKQFICIRSEGNYADVFFIENDELKKKLIRNSLAKIALQLINFETVKRCHRSYIVNLQNVNTVSGNARNYNFHIEKLNFAIPVSRNFPKSIIENIK